MVNVCIIGATSYVGIEIVRILHNHPEINITSLISQNYAGQKISTVYPNFLNIIDKECEPLDVEKVSNSADIFITILPHGISKVVIPSLIEKGKRIIDQSADFRYKNISTYEKWYQTKHEMPFLLQSSVYGLPELYKNKIKNATIVGNPGCYPTCSILSIAPLVVKKLIDFKNIVINAAYGLSEIGKNTSQEIQFCECSDNYKPYNIDSNRHTSEIEQEISLLGEEEIKISFNPHLLPVKRGLFCTISTNLTKNIYYKDIISLYNDFYNDSPFVRILSDNKLPELKWVLGSNYIDIGFTIDKRLNRIIITAALDNLVKGSSGQAIQNLNLMCGFEEKTSLNLPGLYI